jgi:pimeloyl-ACP methyl ester carboxylesterase
MSHLSNFKTAAGETAFLKAYAAAMQAWPIPYAELDIPGRFGTTHVVVGGPRHASPLVLLHGYMATSAMWSPNIVALSREYRTYAVDVMGQPSKSFPEAPIRSADDYVAWLTATLDALHLDRIILAGMSYGGWLALTYAAAVPGRVQKLVLLSPGGLEPIARQFSLRGIAMVYFPTRFLVNSFMGWLGFSRQPGETVLAPLLDSILEVMYLGLKHFRLAPETLRVLPTVIPDDQLRELHVPTLLLIGDHEVMFDAAATLARARRLLPDLQGELVPGARHDMCFNQYRIVNARVVDFLAGPCPNGG